MTPLTESDLAEIRRRMAEAQLKLARRFGISQQAIEAIVRGRPWRRLAEERDADLFD